ncbi:MAG: sigma-70 family RNA polymerase sigma factor [Clostridia bacterium]|nr:sigma-70 family RNA polymerase sigma factor [Clostridia bacterium]
MQVCSSFILIDKIGINATVGMLNYAADHLLIFLLNSEEGRKTVVRINLKEHYFFCDQDEYVDITEEIHQVIKEDERRENAYRFKQHYHHATYTLSRDDENHYSRIQEGPLLEEEVEVRYINQKLHEALSLLTSTQLRRVYAHFYRGLTYEKIAKQEGVCSSAVKKSVKQALKKMKKLLKVEL